MTIANKENEEENEAAIKSNGTIVKMIFHNFLTYDDVICYPGPFLNVIIGPNGTGKSTIICGICLAVGGSPKILGRSEHIGDFIKHGKESGFVELHLYDKNSKGTRAFKVELSRPNSARYFIDGRPASREEHCLNIKKYNIQVDNPCTFLAQDKVKSFAEQDPKQLLKNTEKAGPESLTKMHEDLENLFKQGEVIRRQLGDNRKRREGLEQNIQALKFCADNFREREKRHFKIGLLKKRRALTDYEKSTELHKKAVQAMNKAKTDLKMARDALKPLQKRIAGMEKASGNSETIVQNALAKQNKNLREIDDLLSTDTLEEALNSNATHFALIKQQYNSWEAEKARIAADLDRVSVLYEKAKEECDQPNEDFEKRRADLKSAWQNLKTLDREIRAERNQLTVRNDELRRQVDMERQRFNNKLQALAQLTRNRGIMDAWDFYEKNRDQFIHPVYIPFLHMQVKNEKDLIYLNNSISKRDMAIFIFGCSEDEEKLMGENRFRINSTVVNSDLCEMFRNSIPMPPAMQQLGFSDFVSELFDAPLPIRAYLCSTQRLGRIPIGNNSVDAASEEIGKKIGKEFGLFLTNRSRVTVTFSRYSAAVYVKRTQLHSNPIFNQEHMQKMQDYTEEFRGIQNAIAQNTEKAKIFEEDRKELEQRTEAIREEEKAILEKRNQVIVNEDKMKRIQRRLQEYGKEKPNIEMAAAAFEERKRTAAAEAIRDLNKLTDLLESQRACILELFLASGEKNRLRLELYALRNEYENLESSVRENEAVYRQKADEVEDVNADICIKKREFFQICDHACDERADLSATEKQILDKLKKDFEDYSIPDDQDVVEQQIRDEYNRLEIGRLDGSRQDVEDYENLCKELQELEKVIDNEHNSNESWTNEMNKLLDAWLNPLQALVERINENYSRFFQRLGCASSVELRQADDKYNINEYGIIISVKFRDDTQLRPLTHQTQSGGERSVATMLYLMALQDLCPVPFRCVDEINQGMDPNNERRVFNMMVQLLSATGEVGRTQYFLLTPKLLSGLEFNDRVTVHVVHNGPTIKNSHAWNPEKFLRSLTA